MADRLATCTVHQKLSQIKAKFRHGIFQEVLPVPL